MANPASWTKFFLLKINNPSIFVHKNSNTVWLSFKPLVLWEGVVKNCEFPDRIETSLLEDCHVGGVWRWRVNYFIQRINYSVLKRQKHVYDVITKFRLRRVKKMRGRRINEYMNLYFTIDTMWLVHFKLTADVISSCICPICVAIFWSATTRRWELVIEAQDSNNQGGLRNFIMSTQLSGFKNTTLK